MKYASLHTIITVFKHSETRSTRSESKGGGLTQIPQDKHLFYPAFKTGFVFLES